MHIVLFFFLIFNVLCFIGAKRIAEQEKEHFDKKREEERQAREKEAVKRLKEARAKGIKNYTIRDGERDFLDDRRSWVNMMQADYGDWSGYEDDDYEPCWLKDSDEEELLKRHS
jgi:hypothetical protein